MKYLWIEKGMSRRGKTLNELTTLLYIYYFDYNFATNLIISSNHENMK
jgi:hypothetical protein